MDIATSKLPWEVTKRTKRVDMCHYIVLAEFDIATGSTVRHQFPSKIPGLSEDNLAELMLPEGAHNRDLDYTNIFLNRQGVIIDHSVASTATSENFMYGINVCKTKHDETVRRGAIVKAMALFSPFSFVESFKIPLEQALTSYFEYPSVNILQSLFECINGIDCRAIPAPSALERLAATRGSDFYYDSLGHVIVEQSAQCWYDEFAIELKLRVADPTDSATAASSSVVRSVSGGVLAPSPSLRDVDLGDGATTDEGLHTYNIPFSIPLFQGPDEVGDINLTNFIRLLGDSAMKIYNAILAKKRVLFVGYNHSAASIAQMVLSAVAMVAPVFPGIIRRVYPYANLTDLSFLEVPGYIAGVTNPMFQENEKWWDIVCVLDMPNNKATVKLPEVEKEQKPRRKSGTNPSPANQPSSGAMPNSGSSGNLQALAQDARAPPMAAHNIPHRSRMGQITSKLIPSSSAVNLPGPLMYDVFDEDSDFYQADLKFIHSLLSTVQANSRVQGPEIESWLRIQFREYTLLIMRLIRIHAQLTGHIESHVIVTATPGGSTCTDDPTLGLQLEEDEGIQDSFRIEKLSARLQKTYERNLGRIFLLKDLDHISAVSSGVWLANLLRSRDQSRAGPGNDEATEEANEALLVLTRTIQGAAMKLQMSAELSATEAELVLSTLDKFLTNESRAQLLLLLLPEAQGGLHCIGAHMLNESPFVRKLAFLILQKLSSHASTRSAFAALNFMLKSVYKRLECKIGDDSIASEIAQYQRRQAAAADSHLPAASSNVLEMLSDTAMGALHTTMSIPMHFSLRSSPNSAAHSGGSASQPMAPAPVIAVAPQSQSHTQPHQTPASSQHPPPKPPRPQRGSAAGVGVASLGTEERSREPSSDAAIDTFELLH